MKKVVTCILLALAVAATSGCGKKGPNLEGKWTIDLEPMLKQAKDAGLSSQEISKIKETYTGNRLTVGADRLFVSVDGKPGVEASSYKILTSGDDCSVLESKNVKRKYCVTGTQLRVSNPDVKYDIIYKKA